MRDRFVCLARTSSGFPACALFVAIACASTAQAAPVALDSFNVNLHDASVSGISSGGYMAQQFHVAYSGLLRGAGIVAGGPYYCAKGNVATALTDCTTPTAANPPDVGYSIRATESNAAQATIDAPGNLLHSKVWLFSGSNDQTVYPIVMDRLFEYYLHYVTPANVVYEKTVPAAHSMVTDDYGFACDHKGDSNNPADNYINNCGYDAAGKLLAHIYGPLNPPATALGGAFVEFRQDEFIAAPTSHSMNATGYAYVPAECDDGAQCKVHVAFHGCLQYPARIGDAFYRHAGYNKWADTNRIIVLYPQADASALPPVYNPKGCWDWWGYDDANYANQNGRQMRAVKLMLDRVAAGYDAAPPAPPTALRTTAVTDHTVSIAWTASRGPRLATYRVYYAAGTSGQYVLAGTTDQGSAVVSGLASGTPYSFVVRAFNRRAVESVNSNQTAATTTGLPSLVPPNAVTLMLP